MSNDGDQQSFGHMSWKKKFAISFRGLLVGIKGASGSRNSFVVHIPCAILVLVAAAALKFSPLAISVLVFCIGLVFVAELFNSSIESLSRAITREFDEDIGVALDIASGAVLAASLTAIAVGVILFGHQLLAIFSG